MIYYQDESGILYNGNSLKVLSQLKDESINCVVTSPPYWNLRFYGNESNTVWGGNPECNHVFTTFKNKKIDISPSDKSTLNGKVWKKMKNQNKEYVYGVCRRCGAYYGQLGLETTVDQYLTNLMLIFKEIYRILTPDGTVFVNIADSYSKNKQCGITPKSLCMIPERFAMQMVDNGFILRNQIIWHKPNAMPQSTKDRFTVDFEKIFFFTKNKKYYFKQIFEKFAEGTYDRAKRNRLSQKTEQYSVQNNGISKWSENIDKKDGRNKRCVWSINTANYKGSHVAAYPTKIPETCIIAGCPVDGIVLDPFMGSGTTAVIAKKLGVKWRGIEINDDYCEQIVNRISTIL